MFEHNYVFLLASRFYFAVSACPAAGSNKPKTSMPGSCNAHVCKNKCPAVDLSNFLSHNKCRVDNVCKNRYPAVDLATFYRKISAACVLILPGI